jgi:hypothetical protein
LGGESDAAANKNEKMAARKPTSPTAALPEISGFQISLKAFLRPYISQLKDPMVASAVRLHAVKR